MAALDILATLHFLRPYWLLLLLPFALSIYLLVRSSDPRRPWRGLIAEHLLPSMIVPGGRARWFSPFSAFVLLYPLLAVSLAGPSWQRGTSPLAEDQSALIIAIDLSSSMDSADLQPSRLQRARSKVLDLAKRRGDAYTGLIAYAGTAHTVLPLSNDQDVLLHYLDALETGLLPRRGKAPEAVLPLARAMLERRDNGSLLLIGDGASEAAAGRFTELAGDRRLQLLVWGMGKTRAALERDAERGVMSDAPPLQETRLQAIAEAGRGVYQPVTVDDTDVNRLARRIARHYALSEDDSRPWIDDGYWLLPPILALFLLWFRSGWVLRW